MHHIPLAAISQMPQSKYHHAFHHMYKPSFNKNFYALTASQISIPTKSTLYSIPSPASSLNIMISSKLTLKTSGTTVAQKNLHASAKDARKITLRPQTQSSSSILTNFHLERRPHTYAFVPTTAHKKLIPIVFVSLLAAISLITEATLTHQLQT